MDREQFTNIYWNYYLMLEEKFLNTTRYVELHLNNFSTFSIEFTNLLLTTCSEIDVVFKEMLGFDTKEKHTFKQFIQRVKKEHSDIFEIEVKVIDKEIAINPFEEKGNATERWWRSYNNVKHNRKNKFKEATLENVLYSLGALFVLEMYQFKRFYIKHGYGPDIPKRESDLFFIDGWEVRYLTGRSFLYKLER